MVAGVASADDKAPRVVLWHAYSGAEQAALEATVQAFDKAHPEFHIEVLSVPYEAYSNKLTTAIPNGNGPDLFIGAHDQIGHWSSTQLIEPLAVDGAWRGASLAGVKQEEFHPRTLEALSYQPKDAPRALYALPLAFKSPVLFYRRDKIKSPPKDTDALRALIKEHTSREGPRRSWRYGLVYQVTDFYYHAAWMHGFKGAVTDPETGAILPFATEPNARSFDFARELAQSMPLNTEGAKVKALFQHCLLYTSPSPRDRTRSRMPSSA